MAALGIVSRMAVAGQSELRDFRDDFYSCLFRRADTQFELIDGVCSGVPVAGIAHVTLAGAVRRGHGAAYDAIACGNMDSGRIRDVLVSYLDSDGPADFAVDTTCWARPEALCSPGRGYYHHRHPRAHPVAGQPIVAGWSFSWLVGLTPAADSWTAPLDARCRTVGDNATTVAAQQIKELLPRLGQRPGGPLFVFDAGYDAVVLTTELSHTGAQIVVRLRNDRVMWTRPPEPAPRHGKPGRPKRHGTKFHFRYPASWHDPDQVHTCHDTRYGNVTVQAWHQLHPDRQTSYRDPTGKPSIVEGTILRVQVQHLPGGRPGSKTLWLWWAGPAHTTPDPDRIWRAYLRRFDIEHTFRFLNQVLGWTTPKLRTPQQAQRWTWLIIAAYTQLRLARHLITDHRLPWQKPLPTTKMTPGRVRQGFSHLAPQLGTPAKHPKTSRPGPGRPKGRTSPPAHPHPPAKTTNVKTPKAGPKG